MVECPKCQSFDVGFDHRFQRPRCCTCGWLPEEFKVHVYHLFDPCNKCWGYIELRDGFGCCGKCENRGKMLNSFGKEVIEVFKEYCND